MSSFFTAFGNNFKKIRLRKKYIVIFVLACLCAAFIALFSRGGFSFSLGPLSLNFTDAPYTVLGLFSNFVLPLCAFMIMSDIVAHEIADSSIKSELLRPVSRGKLYMAKSLAALAYCAVLLFAAFIITVLISLFQGASHQIGKLFLSNLMGLLPCAVCIAMSGCIGAFTANPTLGMFLSVVIYAALFAASAFSGFWTAISFTGQLSWYKMILGEQIPWQKLLTSAAMLLSYTVFFSAIGQWLFGRRNIQ